MISNYASRDEPAPDMPPMPLDEDAIYAGEVAARRAAVAEIRACLPAGYERDEIDDWLGRMGQGIRLSLADAAEHLEIDAERLDQLMAHGQLGGVPSETELALEQVALWRAADLAAQVLTAPLGEKSLRTGQG